jgi:hypothetical protein
MAGSFSNRKVSRVARLGGGSRKGGSSSAPIGWYALLAVIVILGLTLVIVSRNERLDATNPGSTPPLAPSAERAGDRWFESYGFYTCDEFAPNLSPDNDPYGITTRDDGVILIAPIARDYAGRNATLGLFAEGVGIELDRDGFTLPGDEREYRGDTQCGDEPGKLVVKEWQDASDPASGEVVDGNPGALLLKDRAAVTVGWVPESFDADELPLPESAENLEQVAGADAATGGGAAPAGETPVPAEGEDPAGAELPAEGEAPAEDTEQ